jgi:hypothetical protein
MVARRLLMHMKVFIAMLENAINTQDARKKLPRGAEDARE